MHQLTPVTPSASSSPLYEPLHPSSREIRLIKVEPSETDDSKICRCTMVKDSLLEPSHKYIALSYVWGDATDTEPLIVNGRHVEATVNLIACLLRYRTINKFVSSWKWTNMFL